MDIQHDMLRQPAILSCILLPLVLLSARADEVTLSSGKIVVGILVRENPQQVVIDTAAGRATLPRSTVAQVRRSAPGANALLRGDMLLKAGKYDEAVSSYRQAAGTLPAESAERIAAAKKMYVEADSAKSARFVGSLAALAPAQQALKLREQLAQKGLSPEQRRQFTMLLVRALVQEEKSATDSQQEQRSLELLLEIVDLAPETPDAAFRVAQHLGRAGTMDARVEAVIAEYAKRHSDDSKTFECYVEYLAGRDPWAAIRMIYPDGQISPRVGERTRALLPGILLACFNRDPYPADAPFDRLSCYERLIALKPGISPLPLLELKVQSNPGSAPDLVRLADYWLREGEQARAIPLLRSSLAIEDRPETRQMLASATTNAETQICSASQELLQRNKVYEAQATCEQGLASIPESKNLADMLRRILQLEECGACERTGGVKCTVCAGKGSVETTIQISGFVNVYEPCEASMVRNPQIKQIIDGSKQLAAKMKGTATLKPYRCVYCGEEVLLGDIMWKPAVKGAVSGIILQDKLPSECKKCGKKDGIGSKTVVQLTVCTACGGKGSTGVCQKCRGAGVVQLKTPRPPGIMNVARLVPAPTSASLALQLASPDEPGTGIVAEQSVPHPAAASTTAPATTLVRTATGASISSAVVTVAAHGSAALVTSAPVPMLSSLREQSDLTTAPPEGVSASYVRPAAAGNAGSAAAGNAGSAAANRPALPEHRLHPAAVVPETQNGLIITVGSILLVLVCGVAGMALVARRFASTSGDNPLASPYTFSCAPEQARDPGSGPARAPGPRDSAVAVVPLDCRIVAWTVLVWMALSFLWILFRLAFVVDLRSVPGCCSAALVLCGFAAFSAHRLLRGRRFGFWATLTALCVLSAWWIIAAMYPAISGTGFPGTALLLGSVVSAALAKCLFGERAEFIDRPKDQNTDSTD